MQIWDRVSHFIEKSQDVLFMHTHEAHQKQSNRGSETISPSKRDYAVAARVTDLNYVVFIYII